MSVPNAYGVRMWLTCPACSMDTPLWREVDAMLCSHCGEYMSLSPGWLEEELKMFESELVPGLEPGVPRTITARRSGQPSRAELIVEAPACPTCRVILPTLDCDHLTGRIYCPSCGAAISARPGPSRLRPSGDVIGLVGEEVGEPDAEPAEEPLILRCMWCANRLPVDGRCRTVTCEECATPNILPPTVWHRLHPEARPPRWYIVKR